MMYALIAVVIPLFVLVSGEISLVPVPIGQSVPVATLTPQHEYLDSDPVLPTQNDSSYPELLYGHSPIPDVEYPIKYDDEGDPDYFNPEIMPDTDVDNDDHPIFGGYYPLGETDDTTIVSRDITLLKRNPIYRGVMQFDCYEAREACQNACWFQNCLQGARGNVQQYTYTNGDYSKTQDNEDRVQAGTTVSRGTPCSTWPFGQRFWDGFPWSQRKAAGLLTLPSESKLECDEWPMASFQNPQFVSSSNPPQRSLRCITQRDNKKGKVQWTNFRNGEGTYSAGGKYERYRVGPAGKMNPFDTFNVNFDLSGFVLTNAVDKAAYDELLYYCYPPYANCANDGRQFHLSNLVRATAGGSGILRWPYDPTTQNAYQIDNQNSDITAYMVQVDITGDSDAKKKYAASVSTFTSGAMKQLTSHGAQQLRVGESLTLSGGGLPASLEITRLSNSVCDKLEFKYSSPGNLNFFVFNSQDKSIKDNPKVTWKEGAGKYCVAKSVASLGGGTRLTCWFPGW